MFVSIIRSESMVPLSLLILPIILKGKNIKRTIEERKKDYKKFVQVFQSLLVSPFIHDSD